MSAARPIGIQLYLSPLSFGSKNVSLSPYYLSLSVPFPSRRQVRGSRNAAYGVCLGSALSSPSSV